MTDLLLSLGGLTLGGSAAILLLALLARTSRARYAARWRCWAWALLCLRLAIPVSFSLPTQEAVQPPIRVPAPSDTVIYTAPVRPVTPPPDQSPALTPPTPIQPVEPPAVTTPVASAEPETPAFTLSLSQAAAGIWLLGAAAMVLWFLLSHLRFLSYLRRWSQPVRDPEVIQLYNALGDELKLDRRPALYTCAGLKAPMLAGLFRPRLLLPEEALSPVDLRCSLLHELTHHRRRDIWLKTLALGANAVHWFNPLVWYGVRLVERDTELACDEAALAHLPPEEHAAYGRTILNAVDRLNR